MVHPKNILFISGFMGHKGEESFLEESGLFENVYHFRICESDPVRVQEELLTTIGEKRPDLLYAYSMGGRLLLSLLEKKELCYLPLVLESVSLGGLTSEQCQQRAQLDRERGEKLAHDFPTFLEKWYKLDLWGFSASEREEMVAMKMQAGLDPVILGEIIANFSPGVFFTQEAKDLLLKRKNFLYLAGAKDEKYRRIAEILGEQAVIVDNCGHNIHFQNPEGVGAVLRKFINEML